MNLSPIIILVEPQLGENIGMAARAMANMGLSRLRLVAPRDGWPSEAATAASSGAAHILEQAQLFQTFHDAIADCHYVVASTARVHRQAKPVAGPQEVARKIHARSKAGQTVAVLFGRERNGLEKEEISRADEILTFPVAEDFPSLNLAQAVLLFGYAWRITGTEEGELLPHVTQLGSPPANVSQLENFFQALVSELAPRGYFEPAHRREVMERNLRNIFLRQSLTEQDVKTLHGVLTAFSKP